MGAGNFTVCGYNVLKLACEKGMLPRYYRIFYAIQNPSRGYSEVCTSATLGVLGFYINGFA